MQERSVKFVIRKCFSGVFALLLLIFLPGLSSCDLYTYGKLGGADKTEADAVDRVVRFVDVPVR